MPKPNTNCTVLHWELQQKERKTKNYQAHYAPDSYMN